jgi:hypothetical protein
VTVTHTRQDDQKRIDDYIIALDEADRRGMTFGGKVAQGVSALPTWMTEFAMTGGMSKLGSDAAKRGLARLLGKYAEGSVARAATGTAALAAGAATRASTGLMPRVIEGTLDSQAMGQIGRGEQETMAESFLKSWGDTAIESFSEDTGGAIMQGVKGAGKLLGKFPGMQKLYTAIGKLKPNLTIPEFIETISTKAGWNGLIGEYGEERVGTILRGITGVEDYGIDEPNPLVRTAKMLEMDLQNAGVELTTLAVPGAARGAAALLSRESRKPGDVPTLGTVPQTPDQKEAKSRPAEKKKPTLTEQVIAQSTPEQMAAAKAREAELLEANRKAVQKQAAEPAAAAEPVPAAGSKVRPAVDRVQQTEAVQGRTGRDEARSELSSSLSSEAGDQGGELPQHNAFSMLENIPLEEIPVKSIRISKDVPNFKEDADEQTGIVQGQRLRGRYTRAGTGPIVVWERADGSLEVVSGRHRLDLARRSGEKTIRSQRVREADGFTKEMALTLDAEMNIMDEKGSVKDYVNYFRNTPVTEEEAAERGLLSRSKQQVGFVIGKSASDDTAAGYLSGKLPEQKAYAIAKGASGNEAAQAAALAKARQKSAEELELYARILSRTAPSDTGKPVQGDLFGFDDTILREADLTSRQAAKEILSLKDRVLAVKGALKRPDKARAMGLNFTDEESIRQEVARLEGRIDALSRFDTNPEVVAEMRQKAGLKPLKEPATPAADVEASTASDHVDRIDYTPANNMYDSPSSEQIESMTNALEKAKDLPFTASPQDIDAKRVHDAYTNTSHSPQQKGSMYQREYIEHMTNLYYELLPFARTDAQKAVLLEEIERYKQGYKDKLYAYLAAHSRVASSFITGSAKFPVRSNQKKSESADKRYAEFSDWSQKAQTSIKKKLRDMSVRDAGGESALMERKLEQAKQMHERMKAANKIIGDRKLTDEQRTTQLQEMGLSLSDISSLLKPDYAGRKGYAGFELTNNLANIKRMEQRVKELKQAEAATGSDAVGTYNGVRIINNNDLQRVQIVFDDKPTDEGIKKLKSKGFRWSPSNNAWQRKNTAQGLRDAKAVIESAGFKAASSDNADLVGRPVLEGGASGSQKEMFDKESFKTVQEQERINAQNDVPGQMDMFGGVKAEQKADPEGSPKTEDAAVDNSALTAEQENLLRRLDIDPATVTAEDAERIIKDYQDGIESESLPDVPLENRRLKGGKRAGGTTILSDVAAEAVGLGHKAINSPLQLGKSAVRMAIRNVKAGNNHIRTLGNAGRRTAEDLDSIVFRATKAANMDNDDIRQVYKGLSKTQREIVAKIVNGRLDASTQKPALVERANKLRDILDRSMNEAKSVGMYRIVKGKKIPIGGSGKAFPQVPNEAGIKFLNEAEEKGLSSDRVFAWATDQVKDGKFETPDQAVSMLQMFRENRLRGVNRYLEASRVELPDEYIEWDGSRILGHLAEKNWLTIEGVRAWGNNFNLVNSRAEQVAARYGRKEAERVKLFIKTSFGVISPASTESQKISDIIRGYQFNTKVGLSPLTILRNMTDRVAKTLTLSTNFAVNLSVAIKYPPFINQFIRYSQRLERDMIRRGAVFGHGSLSEGYEAGSFISDIAGHPFSASERGNQVQIAVTKYLQLKRDLARLEKRGGKDAISTRIANALKLPFQDAVKYRIGEHGGAALLEKAMAGEAIPEDMINEVLHRTVRDKAFPVVISTKPLWYDTHPMVKVLAQFKTWPMKQTAMIWNDVAKYTVKTGDPSRLVGFLIGTLIAGEIYNILRDLLYDKDESIVSTLMAGGDEKDVARAALGDLLDGGVVGMMADFTYGIYDWVTGVSFNTAANIKEAVVASYKRPEMTLSALNRLIQKEVTPVRQVMKLVDKIDREFVNSRNVTKDFFRVRDWAWEYVDSYQNPEMKDKIVKVADDLVYGKTQYKPGDNTLAYQMAARQLQVGDIDDAAKFFKDILDNGGKVSDIKRTMFTWYSPYGHVKDALEPAFLESLPYDKRKIATEVQQQWQENYYDAIGKALGRN